MRYRDENNRALGRGIGTCMINNEYDRVHVNAWLRRV